MYIRCLECQSSTWIETLEPGSPGEPVACQSCGREYVLEVPDDIGATQREQYKTALAFAEGNEIDLPSAYSVLLGIMSLDDARGLGERGVSSSAKEATARTAAIQEAELRSRARGDAIREPANRRRVPESSERREPPIPESPPYDPGFRRAVQEGLLTAKQAMERGDRSAVARHLSQAQGIPMRLAFDVIDNRVSLRKALNLRPLPTRDDIDDGEPRPISARQRNMLLVAACATVVLVALGGHRLWRGYLDEARTIQKLQTVQARKSATEPPEPPARFERDVPDGTGPVAPVHGGLEVVLGKDGQVVQVRGPDPQSVLRRFCSAASETNRFEPVELTPTVPPSPGARLGILRDFENLGSPVAIRIRRSPGSRLWEVGNGRTPIVPRPVPPLPPGAERIAVASSGPA